MVTVRKKPLMSRRSTPPGPFKSSRSAPASARSSPTIGPKTAIENGDFNQPCWKLLQECRLCLLVTQGYEILHEKTFVEDTLEWMRNGPPDRLRLWKRSLIDKLCLGSSFNCWSWVMGLPDCKMPTLQKNPSPLHNFKPCILDHWPNLPTGIISNRNLTHLNEISSTKQIQVIFKPIFVYTVNILLILKYVIDWPMLELSSIGMGPKPALLLRKIRGNLELLKVFL